MENNNFSGANKKLQKKVKEEQRLELIVKKHGLQNFAKQYDFGEIFGALAILVTIIWIYALWAHGYARNTTIQKELLGNMDKYTEVINSPYGDGSRIVNWNTQGEKKITELEEDWFFLEIMSNHWTDKMATFMMILFCEIAWLGITFFVLLIIYGLSYLISRVFTGKHKKGKKGHKRYYEEINTEIDEAKVKVKEEWELLLNNVMFIKFPELKYVTSSNIQNFNGQGNVSYKKIELKEEHRNKWQIKEGEMIDNIEYTEIEKATKLNAGSYIRVHTTIQKNTEGIIEFEHKNYFIQI